MRKDLVLNEDEKKVRFKRLIQRRQDNILSLDEIPSLEPILPNYQRNVIGSRFSHEEHNENLWKQCKPEKIKNSDLSLEDEKEDLKILVKINLALRLSGLSYLMKEVYSGNFEPLRKIVMPADLNSFPSKQEPDINNSYPYMFTEIHELNKHIGQKIHNIQNISLANNFQSSVINDERNFEIKNYFHINRINTNTHTKLEESIFNLIDEDCDRKLSFQNDKLSTIKRKSVIVNKSQT